MFYLFLQNKLTVLVLWSNIIFNQFESDFESDLHSEYNFYFFMCVSTIIPNYLIVLLRYVQE